MVGIFIAVFMAGSFVEEEEPAFRNIYVWDGKTVKVERFDLGTSADVSRLQRSRADLVIVRLQKLDYSVYTKLKKGPKGRRVVLVEFPALSVRADNALLWQNAWDKDKDGKPDAGAPKWLGPRNRFGDYAVDTSDADFRALLVGKGGLAMKVAKAGFDGFVYGTAVEEPKRPGIDAKLLSDVTTSARTARNGYIGILRNPGRLMDYVAIRNFMDGFMVDGLYYGQEKPGVKSEEEFTDENQEKLEESTELKRIILAVSYTSDPKQIRDSRKRAEKKGYLSLELPKRF